MGVLPLKSGSYNAEQGRGGMPMDDILQVNERLRGLIWGAPMLILLLGTGLYFTAVTRVFQVRYCALWLRKTLFSCFTGAARRTSGGVSPFAAMCTALAATVGTGNIAGVATALTLGGPGAVLWLWVSAFVGMMTAFAENTLGMLYRERGADGSWRGGAMLYLKNGLHSPLLAGAFALFCVLASFGIGNMSQCNSIAQGLSGSRSAQLPPRLQFLPTCPVCQALIPSIHRLEPLPHPVLLRMREILPDPACIEPPLRHCEEV